MSMDKNVGLTVLPMDVVDVVCGGANQFYVLYTVETDPTGDPNGPAPKR